MKTSSDFYLVTNLFKAKPSSVLDNVSSPVSWKREVWCLIYTAQTIKNHRNQGHLMHQS